MKKRNLILRETNGFNVEQRRDAPSRLRIRGALSTLNAGSCHAAGTVARHEYDFSRAVEGGETIVSGNDVDTAPRNLHTLAFDVSLGVAAWRAGLDAISRRQVLPRCRQHRELPRARSREPARWASGPRGPARDACASTTFSTTRYADRADFAFGNYRYFPARGRAVFLSVDFARR